MNTESLNSSKNPKQSIKSGGIHFNILLLFFVWPFASLLYAIKNYRQPWAKDVVWWFSIFAGFTFVIASKGVDAHAYRETLIAMSTPGYDLSTLLSSYLTAGSKILDIFFNLVTFFVSRFTDDYRILFAVYGAVFGFFYSRIIWFLIYKSSNKIHFFGAIVLLSYALVLSIWDIGGVRWNTAAMIFLYGILRFLESGKKRNLWWIVFTIFVHWSFVLSLFLVLAYILLGNRIRFYYVLFVISFVAAEINLGAVRDLFVTYAPSVVVESRSSYLSQIYYDSRGLIRETTAWYILLNLWALKWYIFAFVSIMFFRYSKSIKNDALLTRLFCFAMLFYGVFNILSTIPSVSRFLYIGSFLMLGVLFVFMQKNNSASKIIQFIGIPVLLLFIVVRLRYGADYLNVWLFAGNPLVAVFSDNSYNLIDIVKNIFQ